MKDNSEMGLKYIGWGGLDGINVAKGRAKWQAVVNTVMNFQV